MFFQRRPMIFRTSCRLSPVPCQNPMVVNLNPVGDPMPIPVVDITKATVNESQHLKACAS
eukprot:jgi/Botrbrau1/9422/Bobra.0252s0046.1